LYLIEISNNTEVEDEIYVEFKEKTILINKENLSSNIKETKSDLKKKNKGSKIIPDSNFQIFDDTLSVSAQDNNLEVKTDSSTNYESFILKHPTLISLRISLNEQIKKNGIRKSEKDELIAHIEKSMEAYYKMKYPTPVYKFGEKGSGSGISIPIDDIIELLD